MTHLTCLLGSTHPQVPALRAQAVREDQAGRPATPARLGTGRRSLPPTTQRWLRPARPGLGTLRQGHTGTAWRLPGHGPQGTMAPGGRAAQPGGGPAPLGVFKADRPSVCRVCRRLARRPAVGPAQTPPSTRGSLGSSTREPFCPGAVASPGRWHSRRRPGAAFRARTRLRCLSPAEALRARARDPARLCVLRAPWWGNLWAGITGGESPSRSFPPAPSPLRPHVGRLRVWSPSSWLPARLHPCEVTAAHALPHLPVPTVPRLLVTQAPPVAPPVSPPGPAR